MKEKNITHYLFTFDLLEYNFKDIYQSVNVSYFSKDENLLNENLINLDELYYYESVESSTKDKVSVLIKKFKFRVSVMKNFDFSKEIVISDDYDFDVNIMHPPNDLIKIAVVRDNIDKWMNTENLNNYDIIFTTDVESKKLLKKDNIYSFILNENCVYKQVKNILNYLYLRKSKKFYNINKRFNHAFPKQKNYFTVLNSEYFDDDWYRETYNVSNNTDTVIHYLLIGSSKGHNPSAKFNIDEYCQCNLDVDREKMDPLIHYELFGKKDNRIFNTAEIPQRNYSLISNSPYFDKEWYENTYEIPDDIDSVNHYLETGYLKRYNPGPDFNTHEYFQCNLDVKKNMANPLLHYELYGRKEKRKIAFTDEVKQKNYDYIANSPYFDKDWYERNYDIPEDMDPVYHYLNIGFAKNYNPGPDFSTYEYYQCNKDVERHGVNPLLHYEEYGRKEKRFLWLSDMNNNI